MQYAETGDPKTDKINAMVLERLGFDGFGYWTCIYVLIAMSVVFRIASVICLKLSIEKFQ